MSDNVRYITAKDKAGLTELIGKAIASYGKGRIAVQVAIIAILIHAAKHGDYTAANNLVEGLGQGKTARDVVRFFRDFGGLSAEAIKDTDGKEQAANGFNVWQGADYIVAHLDDAKATMFWQHKQSKDNAFQEYSLEDSLRDLIKRHDKMLKAANDGKAKVDDTVTDATMRKVLELVHFEAITAAA
jgi:hypothetical protein